MSNGTATQDPIKMLISSYVGIQPDSQKVADASKDIKSKEKASMLGGLPTALGGPIAAVGMIASIGMSYFANRRAEKEAAEAARLAEVERARIEAIKANLDECVGYLPDIDVQAATPPERLWWQTMISYMIDDILLGSIPSSVEFLTMLHKRVAMGTLSSGRPALAAVFNMLPYLLDDKGTREPIGIVMKNKNDEVIHYLATLDIGVPAQEYSIQNTPWMQPVSADQFGETSHGAAAGTIGYLPINTTKINISDVNSIYIIKGSSSIDVIKGANKYNSILYADSSTGRRFYFTFNLSVAAPTLQKIRGAVNSYYAEIGREAWASAVGKGYEPYKEYQLSTPMVEFLPFVEIGDFDNSSSVVLDWCEEINKSFFTKGYIGSLKNEAINILLYEHGFIDELSDVSDITDKQYPEALKFFQASNHLKPIGYIGTGTDIDIITEEYLRGRWGISREWSPYNGWDVNVSNCRYYGANGVIGIDIPLQEIQKGELVSWSLDNNYSNAGASNNFYTEPITPTVATVWARVHHRADSNNWFNPIVTIKPPYKIVGYDFARGYTDKNAMGSINCTDSTFSFSYYLGTERGKAEAEIEWTMVLYVVKLPEIIANGTIVSKPFFPILHNLSDLQLDYLMVKEYTSVYSIKDWSTFKIEMSSDAAFTSPRPILDVTKNIQWTNGGYSINPNEMFIRWTCELKSNDNLNSPLLEGVKLDFSKPSQIASVDSLKKRLQTLEQNYSNLEKSFVSLEGVDKTLQIAIKLKKIIMFAELDVARNDFVNAAKSFNMLIAARQSYALSTGDDTELRRLSFDLEEEIPVLQIDRKGVSQKVNNAINEAINALTTDMTARIDKSELFLYDSYNIRSQNVGLTDLMINDCLKANNTIISLNSRQGENLADIKDTVSKNISSLKSNCVDYLNNELDKISAYSDGSAIIMGVNERVKVSRAGIEAYIDKEFVMRDPLIKQFWGAIQSALNIYKPEEVSIEFIANPAEIVAGEGSELGWYVANATQIKINGSYRAAIGSERVYPTKSQRYTLTAIDSTGKEVSRTVTIIVNATTTTTTTTTTTNTTVTPVTKQPSNITPILATAAVLLAAFAPKRSGR